MNIIGRRKVVEANNHNILSTFQISKFLNYRSFSVNDRDYRSNKG